MRKKYAQLLIEPTACAACGHAAHLDPCRCSITTSPAGRPTTKAPCLCVPALELRPALAIAS